MNTTRFASTALLFGLAAGLAFVWRAPAEARVRVKRGHAAGMVKTGWRSSVRALSFGPKGRLLAMGGDARHLLLHDVIKGERRWVVSVRGKIGALAFAPDGRHVAVADGQRDVALHEVTKGARTRLLKGLGGKARSLVYSPDGQHLAVAGEAQRIAIFDAASGRLVRRLAGHTSWLAQVAYSPDGRWIAGAGWDHNVRLWEVATGRLVCTAFGHRYALNTLIFSADSRYFYSASDDHTVRMSLASNCAFIKRVRSQPITRFALAGKRNMLLGATFKGLLMFMRQQKLVPYRMIQAHRSPIDALALAPGGRLAATGSRKGKVRLWKLH